MQFYFLFRLYDCVTNKCTLLSFYALAFTLPSSFLTVFLLTIRTRLFSFFSIVWAINTDDMGYKRVLKQPYLNDRLEVRLPYPLQSTWHLWQVMSMKWKSNENEYIFLWYLFLVLAICDRWCIRSQRHIYEKLLKPSAQIFFLPSHKIKQKFNV